MNQSGEGTFKIEELTGLSKFSQIDLDDPIVQIFKTWRQKTEDQKKEVVQTNLCFELMIFLKLKDKDFFDKVCLPKLKAAHMQANAILAWLTDDAEQMKLLLPRF